MLFEHWIYSTAIAIIAGMIHFKKTGRDYSWIIIASAYAPDFDIVADTVFNKLGIPLLGIRHGDFHNIAMLLLYAGLVALVLQVVRYKYLDAFVFAGIGFGAHFFEDVLVENPAYALFWPASTKTFGIGIVDYYPDWYHIADTRVLIFGLIAVVLCATIRVVYEGKGWIKGYVKAIALILVLGAFMVATLTALDVSVIDKLTSSEGGVFVQNWRYGDDTSWDSNVFHSGGHSARIEILGNESKKSGVWISDRFVLKANTSYIFSAWGKTESSGGFFPPAVRVVELYANKSWIKQTDLDFTKGTHNWTQKQIIFETTSYTAWGYVYANIWEGYGMFWFDDVELFEKGKDKNIILNGGFEDGGVMEIKQWSERFITVAQ